MIGDKSMEKKFIFFNDSKNIEEFMDFASLNVYIEQDFDEFKRLIVWASEDAIEYLLQLIDKTKGPYSLMYILKSTRCNNEIARYSISGVKYEEVGSFLKRFEDFFEYDSRHRILVQALSEKLTYFVYDEENMLLAYGDTDKFKSVLNEYGFTEYNKSLVFPDPHMHMYQEEFDEEENEVVNYFNWIKSPLQEIDK